MVKDGIPYVVIPLAIFIVLLFFKLWFAAVPFLFLAAFMAYFFRNPERVVPEDKDLVVSPADGLITRVEQLEENGSNTTVISIFLSPLDVHINRSPIEGKIKSVNYVKGSFKMATRDDASLVNEQNILEIEGEKITVVCKQIAGILARRIVCWKQAGENLKLGERFGLIKFSSRTDLILPANVEVLVKAGMRVKGGTTIIGRIMNV